MSAGTNHSIHRGNSRALRTVNHHPSLLQRVLACNKLVLSTSIVQLFAHAPCRQMKCGSKPDATALLVFSTSILQTKLLAYFCLDQTSSCCSKRLRARAVRRGLGCCQLCLACVLLPKALLTFLYVYLSVTAGLVCPGCSETAFCLRPLLRSTA